MVIPQEEKFKHPEYLQYLELYERTITSLESGARGSGAPEAIILSCLETALSFYEADSAALVEANTELGYGVVVSELCREGVRSFEGRIVGINAEETPFLYDKILTHDLFDVEMDNPPKDLTQNEFALLKRMGVQLLAVGPYCKRYSGYLYVRNPKRFLGLYGMIQALSYVCASERNEFKLMDDLNIAVSSKQCRTDKDVVIKVFGGLSITTKFGTLTESEITSPLGIRLVAYLLLNDTIKVHQRELTEALWPNLEVDAPAKQVKNVVHRIRQILSPIFPDDLVASDKSGNYYINPNINITTDASAFESFYRNGMRPNMPQKEKLVNLLRATEIYQDDFLPKFVGDSWLDNQRTYYRLAYLQTVLALLPILYQDGNYSAMYSVSSDALLYEPDNGDIHYWHIRAMMNLGSYDLAQKHYVQHIAAFSDEQKDILENLLNIRH